MASTPTTKSQVQAYRFVLRRMQSALVRRDAVMLHDPMRNHSRATGVGLLLGIVGLLGFLVFGFFKPAPILDNETQIAISKETGQVYVVDREPAKRLVPMTNLASARLLWYSRSNPDQVQSGGDAPGGTVGGTTEQAAGGTPKLISESALSKWPRGRLTGIPDAPDVLPAKAESRIGAEWSVCDTLELTEFRDNQAAENKIKTTVIAGVSKGNPELSGNDAVLVQQTTGAKKAYLIYKKPDSLADMSSATVRAEVDINNAAVKSALKLDTKSPRAISTGLLNAIQEVKKLEAPKVPGQGEKADYLSGNVKVGDVVNVGRTGDVPETMVVLKDGLQNVSKTVGDLLRFTNSGNKEPASVSPQEAASHRNPTTRLDLNHYPAQVPTTKEALGDNRVMCLGWRADNFKDPNTKSIHTVVTLGSRLPGPTEMVGVKLNQAGATGEVVPEFMMLTGKSAVVRSSQGKGDFGAGQIQIISGRGVRYHIPDTGTASALGLDNASNYPPAPETILGLLPNGPQLNRNAATMSYDSIPAQGVVPEDSSSAASK